MYRVKEIHIKGFWGDRSISTKFNSDVTIFLGKNGTGKTTLINFLEGILNADIYILNNLDFESVDLILSDDKGSRTISVIKETKQRPYPLYQFRIWRDKFTISSLLERGRFRRRALHPARVREFREEYTRLKDALSEMVNVSWLSVHRGVDIGEANYREDEEFEIRSSVDQRLKVLTREFLNYQLSLIKQSDQSYNEFQNKVLASLLYNEQLDRVDLDKFSKIDISQEKQNLLQIYTQFGLNIDNLQPQIDKHFEILNTSIDRIRKSLEKSKESKKSAMFTFEDVSIIPLISRTNNLLQLRREHKDKITKIFKPIDAFLKQINEYFIDKQIDIDMDGNIDINDIAGKELSLNNLSSGEKQLLIILLEAILQYNTPCIFIADEPEISLHIEWQEKLLDSIRNLNNQAQLIIATHSPEIVSDYRKNVIHMESLLHG